MMNLILILAFSVLVPSCILCETNVGEDGSRFDKGKSTQVRALSKKFNSSHTLSQHEIVKREISVDPNDIPYPYYNVPTEMMLKRTAAGLNKFIYVLRNSFDKSAVSPMENGVESKENFSQDVTRAITRDSNLDRFPTTLVERRGQPQKDRKVYLRCYFNAVSCFKKKK